MALRFSPCLLAAFIEWLPGCHLEMEPAGNFLRTVLGCHDERLMAPSWIEISPVVIRVWFLCLLMRRVLLSFYQPRWIVERKSECPTGSHPTLVSSETRRHRRTCASDLSGRHAWRLEMKNDSENIIDGTNYLLYYSAYFWQNPRPA